MGREPGNNFKVSSPSWVFGDIGDNLHLEIHFSTLGSVIVGVVNMHLSATDKTSKWKIRKRTEVLNSKINYQDLITVYKMFHATTAERPVFQMLVKRSPG